MAPPTAAATVAWARADLGRTEQPPGSNRFVGHDGVDLWSWYDPRLQRNPWCASWVSRCWAATGDPIPIQTELGFHYTPTGLAWFRRRGLVVPKAEAQPGDIMFCQFDDDPQVDHVGLIESVGLGHLVTIEGNTSPDSRGSQSNGGGVFRRKRWSSVAAVCRPPYAPDGAARTIHQQELDMASRIAALVTVPGIDANGNGYVDVGPWGSIGDVSLNQGGYPVDPSRTPVVTGRGDFGGQTRVYVRGPAGHGPFDLVVERFV